MIIVIFTIGKAISCLCLIVSAFLIAWFFICLKMIESNINGYGANDCGVHFVSAKPICYVFCCFY